MTPVPTSNGARPIQACARCRRRKTRCNRAKPRCSRCAAANAQCDYHAEKPGARDTVTHVALSISGDKAAEDSSDSVDLHSVQLLSPEATTSSINSIHCADNERGPPRDQVAVGTTDRPQDQRPRAETAEQTQHCPRRTRDRPILSCLRCRQHKVRCDRAMPCGRCSRLDKRTECVYPPRFSPAVLSAEDQKFLGAIATTFVDDDWQKRFRNGTHWKILLHEDPAADQAQMRDHLPACHVEKVYPEPMPDTTAISINFPFGEEDASPSDSIRGALSQLPVKHVQRSCVDHYINTVEEAYHLFDRPSFNEELQSFWNDTSFDHGWLAQYFMVLSLGCQARNFASASPADANTDLPSRLLRAAESCLRRSPFLFRPTLENVRTLCLMVVSKQVYAMSCHETDTCWPLTGMAVRLAITMGLHFPATSAGGGGSHGDGGHSHSHGHGHSDGPTKEETGAKRRLWAAVLFLEMRQSVVCGMPLLLPSHDALCSMSQAIPSPRPATDAHPSPRSPGQEAEAAATTATAPSQDRSPIEEMFSATGKLLLRALELATSPDTDVSHAQVVQVDLALRSHLRQSVPSLSTLDFPLDLPDGDGDSDSDGSGAGASGIGSAAVDVFLRQVLMALHARFALRRSSPTRYPVSYFSSLESALALLSQQQGLFDAGDKRVVWFAGFFRPEFFTAAMTVCCHLIRSHSRGERCQGGDRGWACEEGDGRSLEIMLDALQSCRDVWGRERDVSLCNANAFVLVDNLIAVLRSVHCTAPTY